MSVLIQYSQAVISTTNPAPSVEDTGQQAGNLPMASTSST